MSFNIMRKLLIAGKVYTCGFMLTSAHVTYNTYLAYKINKESNEKLDLDYAIIYSIGSTVAWPVYWSSEIYEYYNSKNN